MRFLWMGSIVILLFCIGLNIWCMLRSNQLCRDYREAIRRALDAEARFTEAKEIYIRLKKQLQQKEEEKHAGIQGN